MCERSIDRIRSLLIGLVNILAHSISHRDYFRFISFHFHVVFILKNHHYRARYTLNHLGGEEKREENSIVTLSFVVVRYFPLLWNDFCWLIACIENMMMELSPFIGDWHRSIKCKHLFGFGFFF